MSRCNNMGSQIKGYLMVGKNQRKDILLIAEGKHPRFKDIVSFIEKVNSDGRYKHKIRYILPNE